mmetsp:Transcript_23641/g.54418  ORF Transcript_23641/g.54418 Transcript_23641/m.54418 type:complete len:272 (-) Transcript_23641:746-1561(-)
MVCARHRPPRDPQPTVAYHLTLPGADASSCKINGGEHTVHDVDEFLGLDLRGQSREARQVCLEDGARRPSLRLAPHRPLARRVVHKLLCFEGHKATDHPHHLAVLALEVSLRPKDHSPPCVESDEGTPKRKYRCDEGKHVLVHAQPIADQHLPSSLLPLPSDAEGVGSARDENETDGSRGEDQEKVPRGKQPVPSRLLLRVEVEVGYGRQEADSDGISRPLTQRHPALQSTQCCRDDEDDEAEEDVVQLGVGHGVSEALRVCETKGGHGAN